MNELTQWYKTPPGQILYQREKILLAQLLPQCFGYHLLQIGGSDDISWLQPTPIKKKFLLLPQPQFVYCPTFVGHPEQLPFQPNSMDVVILPHTLDIADNLENTLAEAVQVLSPGGTLIILGINQLGLWHAQNGYHQLTRQKPLFPWLKKAYSSAKIKTKIESFSCEIEALHFFCYQPWDKSINHEKKFSHYQQNHLYWESFGGLLWPTCSNLYAILARKKIHALTPLVTSALFEF